MDNKRRLELNEKRLSEPMIKPELEKRCRALIADLEALGIKPLVTQGFRSIKEQNDLYAQGRTKAGKIVTNARGGKSNHNFGNAVDFAFVDDSGAVVWDMKLFRQLGALTSKHGLKWGGNWKSFKDYPHVEL